jgi:hypothetical protein
LSIPLPPLTLDRSQRCRFAVAVLRAWSRLAGDLDRVSSFTLVWPNPAVDQLERLMVRSIEAANWMSTELTSARQPRLVVSLVVEELKVSAGCTAAFCIDSDTIKTVEAAVGRLFGAEAEGSSLVRTTSKMAPSSSAYYRGGVGNEEMARMFNEKIRIYDRVEFSAHSVVALLVRCVLKVCS